MLAFILTPVIFISIICLICYFFSEIQIDSMAISNIWPFNVKRQILWKEVSKITWGNQDSGHGIPNLMISNRKGDQIIIRRQFDRFSEMIDEINDKFPFGDYKKIIK